MDNIKIWQLRLQCVGTDKNVKNTLNPTQGIGVDRQFQDLTAWILLIAKALF